MRVVRSKRTELTVIFEQEGKMHDCEMLTDAVKISYQLDLAFNCYTLKGIQNIVVMIFHGKEDTITYMEQFYNLR